MGLRDPLKFGSKGGDIANFGSGLAGIFDVVADGIQVVDAVNNIALMPFSSASQRRALIDDTTLTAQQMAHGALDLVNGDTGRQLEIMRREALQGNPDAQNELVRTGVAAGIGVLLGSKIPKMPKIPRIRKKGHSAVVSESPSGPSVSALTDNEAGIAPDRADVSILKDYTSGGSRLQTTASEQAAIDRYPDSTTIGHPREFYISPSHEISHLLELARQTENPRRFLEKNLGLPEGALAAGDLVRIDIPDVDKFGPLRVPDPEFGNELHIPLSGRTPGGQGEAVIDSPLRQDTDSYVRSIIEGM